MPENNNESNEVKKFSFAKSLLISLAFFALGCSLVALSVYEYLSLEEKKETYTETIGKISSHNMNNKLLKAIIVEYEVDGEWYEIESNQYSNNAESVGTVVSIKYNPKDPSDAIFSYQPMSWVLPTISVIVLLIGFGMIIRSFKKKFKKKVPELVEENKEETVIVEKKRDIHASPDQHTLGQLREPNSTNEEENNM